MFRKVQINVPFPLLQKNIDGILGMGLQPEIYFSGLILDHLSPAEVTQVAQKLKQKNIPVTFHAPFMDLSPGSVDEKIREVTSLRFQQILDLVPFFSPRTIVFHPGYDRWHFDGDVDLWLKNSLITWKPMVKQAESLGIKLAVENVFEENPSILKKLFSSIDSPHLGYCLDAGHGHIFSEVAITEWIEVLGPWLVEMHLHDNHRQADDHLPLGQGKIDFPGIFSLLKAKRIQPIYTIEPHLIEHLEPSLKALEKFL
jgi:sugar phosphate isomerase/epimerase